MISKVSKCKAQLVTKEQHTDSVYRIEFKLITPAEIEFVPGQFANILVADKIRRSYSISSNPLQKDVLETYVDVSPGGPGSKFFLDLQVGDNVEMLAPLGMFVYRQPVADFSEGPAVFLATGTGIAPFLAIFIDELENKKSKREILLYFGLRYEKDIFALKFLEELADKYTNFKFRISLSKPSDHWLGDHGYCTQLLAADWTNINGIENAQFYLCGAGDMLVDSKEFLRIKSIPSENIFFEKYY